MVNPDQWLRMVAGNVGEEHTMSNEAQENPQGSYVFLLLWIQGNLAGAGIVVCLELKVG